MPVASPLLAHVPSLPQRPVRTPLPESGRTDRMHSSMGRVKRALTLRDGAPLLPRANQASSCRAGGIDRAWRSRLNPIAGNTVTARQETAISGWYDAGRPQGSGEQQKVHLGDCSETKVEAVVGRLKSLPRVVRISQSQSTWTSPVVSGCQSDAKCDAGEGARYGRRVLLLFSRGLIISFMICTQATTRSCSPRTMRAFARNERIRRKTRIKNGWEIRKEVCGRLWR